MKAEDYVLTMTEEDLQGSVEDMLTTLRYLWFHDEDARRDQAGLPDLIAVHPLTGFLIMVELKKEKGTVRVKQAKWLAALQLRKRPDYYVGIWRPRHWQSGMIQQILRHGAGASRGNGS